MHTLIFFLDNGCEQCAAVLDTTACSCSCTSEVGIPVGAIIEVECLIIVAITIIVVQCLWRYIRELK